jgi:hypothetical protein
MEIRCLMLQSFKSFSKSTPTSGQIVEGNLFKFLKNHLLHLFKDPLCKNLDKKAQLRFRQDSIKTFL